MPRAATVRQADLQRAIRALQAAGMGVARIEVRPGGEVVIVPGPALTLGEAASQPPDELTAWREQRARRAAQGS